MKPYSTVLSGDRDVFITIKLLIKSVIFTTRYGYFTFSLFTPLYFILKEAYCGKLGITFLDPDKTKL
jgi:hypothetical protein